MKGLVIDASIAGNWLLDEQAHPVAQRARDLMLKGTPACVPSLWILEIANVVFVAERRRRISPRLRADALARIGQLPVTIHDPPGIFELTALSQYAERHQLTSYDAEYLRVAKVQGYSLATLDGNLLAAARREKVAVLAA